MELHVNEEQWLLLFRIALAIMAAATALSFGAALLILRHYRRDVGAAVKRLIEAEHRASAMSERLRAAVRQINDGLVERRRDEAAGGAQQAAADALRACEEARNQIHKLASDLRAALDPSRNPAIKDALVSLTVGGERPAAGAAPERGLQPLSITPPPAPGPAIEYHYRDGWDIISWKGVWEAGSRERLLQATRDLLDDLQGPLRRRVTLDLTSLQGWPKNPSEVLSEIATHAESNRQVLRIAAGSAGRCASIAERWSSESGGSVPALFATVGEAVSAS